MIVARFVCHLGVIFPSLSRCGASFWRPDSRNLCGGTPWSPLGSFWAPFGLHLGPSFWAPFGLHLGRFSDPFDPFGPFSDPFCLRFRTLRVPSYFSLYFCPISIVLSPLVHEIPFNRSTRSQNMGRRNSRRDNNFQTSRFIDFYGFRLPLWLHLGTFICNFIGLFRASILY